MSEKLYTAAEVAKMIADERAKLVSKKAVKIYADSGTFKPTSGPKKGIETPFANVKIEGDFYPAKLSFAAAEAVLANIEALKAAVAEGRNPKPVADPNAPRLAPKA